MKIGAVREERWKKNKSCIKRNVGFPILTK